MPLGETLDLEFEGRDDPVRVTYTGVDMRRWEDKNDRSILIEPRSLSMLTWLGWSAATRTGAVDGELKDWRTFNDQCIGLQVVREEAAEARPTKRGRGGGSSAP